MNNKSLSLWEGRLPLFLALLTGLFALSSAVAQDRDPKAEHSSLPSSLPPQEMEGLSLQLRIFFKPLPDKMPGSQNDSPEMIALGRKLFFERRISLNKTQSCNDCHRLDDRQAGVDNQATSKGAGGQLGKRNSPTVLNAGFQVAQFWDGRAPDLVEQAKGPILNPIEMGMRSPEEVVARLKEIEEYRRAFPRTFPKQAEPLTYDNVARAIAAFERTLITPSRFDRYLKGDRKALTGEEEHGLHRFVETGCVECHSSYAVGGRIFQKLGVYHPYTNQQDSGRYEETRQEKDRMVFKVPMLRNITRTAPYFHDGQVKTLPEAVQLMARLQLDLVLDKRGIDEIVKFLHTLTAERPVDIP